MQKTEKRYKNVLQNTNFNMHFAKNNQVLTEKILDI